MPVGIRQSRARGWRKPPGAISVARGPGRKYGNPFKVGDIVGPDHPEWELVKWMHAERHLVGDWIPFKISDAHHAVEVFRTYVGAKVMPDGWPLTSHIVTDLHGHDLMCFCPVGSPCHRDVLLDIAARRA